MREMVLDRAGNFHGYLGMVKKVQDPGGYGCRLVYNFLQTPEGEKTVGVQFEFFGVAMFTDLEIRDPKHATGIHEDYVKLFCF